MLIFTLPEFLAMRFPHAEPLVQGILSKGTNLFLVAPHKSAKTILALQLGLSVAHGVPVAGKWPTRQGRVLYLAFEGAPEDLQETQQRLVTQLGIEPSPAFVFARLPYLYINTTEGYTLLSKLVAEHRPDLLILDPLRQVHRGSLTEDGEPGVTVGRLEELALQNGHATLINHHFHRPKRDNWGSVIEEGGEAYFGSYVWGAWPDRMLGLKARTYKGHVTSVTISCFFERKPMFGEPVTLDLTDEPDRLGFRAAATDTVRLALPSIVGLSVRAAATKLGLHHEEVARALRLLAAEGVIAFERGGPGKPSLISLDTAIDEGLQ